MLGVIKVKVDLKTHLKFDLIRVLAGNTTLNFNFIIAQN